MAADSPLILIDGSSYLFRAYHALPPLSTSDGRQTGAVKGVISMVRSLRNEHPDSPVAVVFDAKGDTFRNELYAEYKANRPPMPEELQEQIEPIHDIIRSMGLPLLIVEGVEADDVIGTLAAEATRNQRDVLISTGDKDLAQLVSDHVTLLNTMSGERLDIEGVQRKFSLPPESIVDYLALTGDKSDNIPGVEGVGPKTAVKWLQQYGSVDRIIENADEIGGKIGEKLRNNIEQLKLSRELATIRQDVGLDVGIDDLVPGPEDKPRLLALFDELQFRAWVRELESEGVKAGDNERQSVRESLRPADDSGEQQEMALDEIDLHPLQTDYRCVTDRQALDRCLEQLRDAERFAVFLTHEENVHYLDATLTGVAVAWASGQAAYIPLAHDEPGDGGQLDRGLVLERLQPLLEDLRAHKVVHDNKLTTHMLENHDLDFAGVRFDTLLGAYVLNSTNAEHELAAIARYYLRESPPDVSEALGSGRSRRAFRQLPLDLAAPHAAGCADLVLRLSHLLSDRLARTGAMADLFEHFEMRLSPVLQRMERRGIRIDADCLARQSEELAKQLEAVEQKAFELAGESFNLNSPRQLQHILYERMELPVIRKTPTGQPSTAENVLQELALDYELPSCIMEHRAMSKLKSTYTDKLPTQINATTGRIHTTFQQAVTVTGRLSSTDPNLQNIPIRSPEGRRVRQAFIAEPGYRLLAADYSQVELRIMAHLSGDRGLLQAFAEGRDIHQATAAEVFGLALEDVDSEHRRRAKAINFGLIYGMSAYGLSRQLGIERRDAQHYVNRYFERYPGVADYMERTRTRAEEDGYVETIFGRRLYLPDINAANGNLRRAAQRTAINAPMQGSAADIIKQAMVDIDDWLGSSEAPQARLLLQVHDELIFEVLEQDIDLVSDGVRFRMVSAASLDVPLITDVNVGDNWDEAH